MRLGDLDALKNVMKCNLHSWGAQGIFVDEVMKTIDNAPTIEPEKTIVSEIVKAYKRGFDMGVETARPKGEWIKIVNKISETETKTHWECSKCHNPDFRFGEAEFCSFCGAEMKGGAENDK